MKTIVGFLEVSSKMYHIKAECFHHSHLLAEQQGNGRLSHLYIQPPGRTKLFRYIKQRWQASQKLSSWMPVIGRLMYDRLDIMHSLWEWVQTLSPLASEAILVLPHLLPHLLDISKHLTIISSAVIWPAHTARYSGAPQPTPWSPSSLSKILFTNVLKLRRRHCDVWIVSQALQLQLLLTRTDNIVIFCCNTGVRG